MSDIRSYKDLLIWQKAIDLVVHVYNILKEFPSDERFVLGAQIRRCAVSVPSNIAEGQARKHTAEFRQFLYISLGSLAELDTQIIISEKLGYLGSDESSLFNEEMIELRKMIFGVIKKLPTNH